MHSKNNESKIRKFFISTSAEEKTFMYDENLPSLPVPDLDQTLDRYLKSIAPLVSENEFNKTTTLVEEFRNGVGKNLQRMLIEKASKTKNWMAEWWSKYAYLMLREPIAPTINMAGPQSLNLTIWRPNKEKTLERAALSMWVVLDFYVHLRKERIRPQISKKGKQLNMQQFRYLFNTTRIPMEGIDRIDNYFKTESEGSCPSNVIIICNGHLWSLNPFFSKDEIMTAPEIEDHLKYIKYMSESLGEGQRIAALTFNHREKWAKNRRWLMDLSAQNKENLMIIESAILVFALDRNSPKDLNEVCQMSLCGDPSNRWADKSYGAIAFDNGYQGTSNDHSPYDAMVSVAVGHYQHAVISEEFGGSWKGPKTIRKTPRPTRLVFAVDDTLKDAIEDSISVNRNLRASIGIKFAVFSQFGKNWIKKIKVHPDAFLQCSLQLAYFLQHKKFAPTYETATTRQFYQARTETIRSCTSEMKEFVLAMVADQTSTKEKRLKLISAVERHRSLTAECEGAQGIDRHLMGLYLISIENGLPVPNIFMDPSFALSGGGGNFVLSTSTVGYTYVLGGVAAMVKNGYGVFYSMLPDRLHFFITNFVGGESCLEGFFSSISEALLRMQQVMAEPQPQL